MGKIVHLHEQTARSWSKFFIPGQNCYFALANLACIHKCAFMGNLCICICKHTIHGRTQRLCLHIIISMAMTKRHVLVLASFFMCTLCMLAQAHVLCLKRLDPLLAALSPHQGIPTFLFSCSRFPFHHIERLSCAILYSTDT